MKQDDFVTISDVHIKSENDPNYKVFLNFFNNEYVKKSKYIFLLGDIFDVLVGQYEEYNKMYKEFFQILDENLSLNKKIFWIEGNHDFHFQEVLKRGLSKKNIKKIGYRKNSIKIIKGDDHFYISHGDELDIKNPNYLKYRNFMRSHIVETIINHIIPFDIAMNLKEKMSNKSRRLQVDFNEANSKNQYREYSKLVKSFGYNKVITGHSHIIDEFEGYFNNGYFPNTKKFIYGGESQVELISLV